MIVTLTDEELLFGGYAGLIRHVNALTRNATPGRGLSLVESSSWDLHITGALAELAVARFLGRYWSGLQGPGSIDVRGVEVKHSGYDDAHLILGADARDELPFVLVTGVAPSFDLRGWTLGCVGKDVRFWQGNGRPAYWVPQKCLRPIEHLALYLDGQPIGGGV